MAEAHPVGLPVGDGGEAEGRDGHPRRPALHSHVGHRRHPCADPGRFRHRVPRRPGQPRTEQRPRLPRVRRGLHQRSRRSSTRSSGTPRISTGCSRVSTRRPAHYDPRLVALRATRRSSRTTAATPRSWPRTKAEAAAPSSRTRRRTSETHGSGGPRSAGRDAATRRSSTRAASSRSSSATTPATRRRWCRRSAGSRPEKFAQVADALDQQQRTGADGRDLLRGRLDPPQRRGPDDPYGGDPAERCWATSGAPAAGSWRCAATPPSRARPTSRPCSTSCPATCRCPTPTSTRRSTTGSVTTRARPASGATSGRTP